MEWPVNLLMALFRRLLLTSSSFVDGILIVFSQRGSSGRLIDVFLMKTSELKHLLPCDGSEKTVYAYR